MPVDFFPYHLIILNKISLKINFWILTVFVMLRLLYALLNDRSSYPKHRFRAQKNFIAWQEYIQKTWYSIFVLFNFIINCYRWVIFDWNEFYFVLNIKTFTPKKPHRHILIEHRDGIQLTLISFLCLFCSTINKQFRSVLIVR